MEETGKIAVVKDPQLKRLKEEKHQWQMLVKLIIAKLQAFKKGISGKGDEETHLPPVNIKEKFPEEYSVYLNSIAEDYVNLVEGAKRIMDHQAEYATKRSRPSRKKMLEQIASGDPEVASELVSEASWWGSRLWSRLALIKLQKEERKLRVRLLKALRDSIKDLYAIEDFLLKKDHDAIAEATKEFLKFSRIFHEVVLPDLKELGKLGGAEKLLHEGAEDSGDKEPDEEGEAFTGELVDSDEDEKNEEGDVVVRETPPTPDLSEHLERLKRKATSAENRLALISERLPESQRKKFQAALGLINNMLINLDEYDEEEIEGLEGRLDTVNNDLEKFVAEFKAEAELLIDDDINKVADNVMTRWVKRKLLSVNPSRQENVKLDVIELMHDFNDEIDKLMDSLEDPSVPNSKILARESVLRDFVFKTGRKIYFLANLYYDYAKKPKLRRTHLTNLKKLLNEVKPKKEDDEG